MTGIVLVRALRVIAFLKAERANMRPEGSEDEAYAEHWGHLTDVIDALERNEMSIESAGDSLGYDFVKRGLI